MDFAFAILTIIGLCLFEVVMSIDNAIINASVLKTMGKAARRWFLIWGIFIAVFVVRGAMPWLIIWITTPSLGPIGAITATFSSDPNVALAIDRSAPILLIAGGTFLIFLFFNWLFLEDKNYALFGEKFLRRQAVWFFAIVSILLSLLVWFAIKKDPLMALGAVVGSTAFFITHGFRENAQKTEEKLVNSKSGISDLSKIFYLEVLDATFSIDGILGAFAFTFSLPLILIGNGIGAIVVRQLTVGNIENVSKLKYITNGAMYSVLALGIIMILESFRIHIPPYFSPMLTFTFVGFFFVLSIRDLKTKPSSSHLK